MSSVSKSTPLYAKDYVLRTKTSGSLSNVTMKYFYIVLNVKFLYTNEDLSNLQWYFLFEKSCFTNSRQRFAYLFQHKNDVLLSYFSKHFGFTMVFYNGIKN